MTKAYLSLGSNLGDRLVNLIEAVSLLNATDGVDVTRSSRVYETDPVGGPEDQPAFLNAVVEVRASLDARALLDACLGVETKMGRVSEIGQCGGPAVDHAQRDDFQVHLWVSGAQRQGDGI